MEIHHILNSISVSIQLYVVILKSNHVIHINLLLLDELNFMLLHISL